MFCLAQSDPANAIITFRLDSTAGDSSEDVMLDVTPTDVTPLNVTPADVTPLMAEGPKADGCEVVVGK